MKYNQLITNKTFAWKYYILATVIIVLTNTYSVNGQQTAQESVIKTEYLIYFPTGYNSGENSKWPLLIYLHGAGIRERSVSGLRDDYLAWHLDHELVLPFIVVSPVCNTNGWDPTILNFLLDDLIRKYRVDENRVYLTGHSMGGFGTWKWAVNNPDRFAAIAPVSGCCSDIDSASAWKLRNMPVWVFHGKNDNVVDIQCNIDMVDQLEKFSHKVKFLIYPDRGHDTWEPAFSNKELYSWFEKQNRMNNIPGPAKVNNSILKSYSGKYVHNIDTLEIGNSGEAISLNTMDKQKITLVSESETIFSIDGQPDIGIIFMITGKKIKGFSLMNKNILFFTRIESR